MFSPGALGKHNIRSDWRARRLTDLESRCPIHSHQGRIYIPATAAPPAPYLGSATISGVLRLFANLLLTAGDRFSGGRPIGYRRDTCTESIPFASRCSRGPRVDSRLEASPIGFLLWRLEVAVTFGAQTYSISLSLKEGIWNIGI